MKTSTLGWLESQLAWQRESPKSVRRSNAIRNYSRWPRRAAKSSAPGSPTSALELSSKAAARPSTKNRTRSIPT